MKSALSALVICAVAGSVGVVSCGGSETSVTDPTTQVGCIPEQIHISPSSATLHPGDSLHILAIFTPCQGVPRTILLQWRSTNDSIATVGIDGTVHAYSRGQATMIGSPPGDPDVQNALALVVQ